MKRGNNVLLPLVFTISYCFFIPAIITNLAYADSLTLSVDTNNVSLNLAPTTSVGTFTESSSTSITVSTTSSSGYTLSFASSTGSTDLTNTTDNTAKITSISSNLTDSVFSNPSNTQYNNKWGYKPSQYITTSGDSYTTHLNTGNNAVFKPLPDDTGEILAITECANGTSPCASQSDTYTISMGARVNGSTLVGSYQSSSFVIMAVANSNLVSCDDTKLCVEYDGNGLNFDGELINRVNYNSTVTQSEITRILHSDNVSDEGISSGNSEVNIDQTKEVTINGANSVNVTLYYDTEDDYCDWVTVYSGTDSVPSETNDETIGSHGNLSGKLGGNKTGFNTSYTSWNVWDNNGESIDSNTIKIHFVTDDYAGEYITYGYYAVITSNPVYSRPASSGEYATPNGTNAHFYGWSTTATTPGSGHSSQVEYANESVVKAKMSGNNGDSEVLYAVWQQGQTITFAKDANVFSIEIFDSNNVLVDTITTNGQSTLLLQSDTYTLRPSHAPGYGTDSVAVSSGAGSLNGNEYTVGTGSATISVTSEQFCANTTVMQDLTSSALGTLLPNVNNTATVCDIRDGHNYAIAKLADNKYWMIENLNIAGGTELSYTDTNFESSYTLPTTGGWSTHNGKLVLPASSTSGFNTSNKAYVYNTGNETSTCSKPGCHSYYSWDAATVGSGRSITSSNQNAPYSICPKGWRLPTTYDGSGTSAGATDIRALINAYGGSNSIQHYSSSDNPSGATLYSLLGPVSTPNYLLTGYYFGKFYEGGKTGYSWTASSESDSFAHSFYFTSTVFDLAMSSNRALGLSVRCLFGG